MVNVHTQELDDLLEEVEKDCTSRFLVTVANGVEDIKLAFQQDESGEVIKEPDVPHHLVMKAKMIRMIVETAAGMVVRHFRDEENPESGYKHQDVLHYFICKRDGRIVVDKRAQFTEMGIGIIGGCNLDYFTEEIMARRNHGKRREFVRFSRPVAEISGEAQVQDPKAFEAGFVKGMGRHRSFGYGMVSLSVGT